MPNRTALTLAAAGTAFVLFVGGGLAGWLAGGRASAHPAPAGGVVVDSPGAAVPGETAGAPLLLPASPGAAATGSTGSALEAGRSPVSRSEVSPDAPSGSPSSALPVQGGWRAEAREHETRSRTRAPSFLGERRGHDDD